MGRPSSGEFQSGFYTRVTSLQLATMNGSTSQFLLAEKMARHGATDDHIMGVIGEQMPVTQLSLEEQQIQQSLIRLDNRLNNIQVSTLHLNTILLTLTFRATNPTGAIK